MIGNCDACDRKNVPVSNCNSSSGETTQCFLCQGDTDPDPYCEVEHDRSGKIIGDGETGYNFSCSKCGAALHSDKPAEGDQCLDCVLEPTPLEAAKKLLIGASIGSCTCETKSPDLIWHAPNCRYVTIMTALENVEIAREQASQARALVEHMRACQKDEGQK
jgi:hypothetical protein